MTLKPTGTFWFWLGVTAMAMGVFVDITKELLEGEVDAIDRAIVLAIARVRTPWVTVAAVDLTSLGSITVVALFSILAIVTLLVLRDRRGALQILSAFGGAVLWTQVTKGLIDRARPEVVPRLVEVSGFSYPSGHSLAAASVYLTISILVSQHLQTTHARIAIFAMQDSSSCWLLFRVCILGSTIRLMLLAVSRSAGHGRSYSQVLFL